MARKAYIGVDSAARWLRKGYVGVDGTARRLRKVYVGIGSVARPCWSDGEPAYYGTAEQLTFGVRTLAATANAAYAIFAGGYSITSKVYATANAYDAELTHIGAPDLKDPVSYLSAAPVGQYAVFAGGGLSNSIARASVTAYNAVLTQKTPELLSQARMQLGATYNDLFTIFAGGLSAIGSTYYDNVDAYDAELTRTSASNLPEKCCGSSGAGLAEYAILGGGNSSDTLITRALAYDRSLTQTPLDGLSTGASHFAAGRTAHYVMLITAEGGNAYDADLTRYDLPPLAVTRSHVASASVGDLVLVAGGCINQNSISVAKNNMEYYDDSLTRFTGQPLSVPRYNGAMAAIGSFALYAGGVTTGIAYTDANGNYHGSDTVTLQSTVDVYTV